MWELLRGLGLVLICMGKACSVKMPREPLVEFDVFM